MHKLSTDHLGIFSVATGSVMVTDPCYERGTWCQGRLKKVLNGDWKAKVVKSDEGQWGERVAYLIAWNTEIGEPDPGASHWQKRKFEVGVDSGQAGIFDDGAYPKEDTEEDGFYSDVSDLTLSERQAGVTSRGCVSSSGYGDGGYDCFTSKNADGLVDAIMIDFGVCELEYDW